MKIKRFAAGMCALALCFGIASCGSDSSEGGATTTAKKEEATTTTAAESKEEITMKEEHVEQIQEISKELGEDTLENTDLKFFSHWDINPADGSVVSPEIKLWREKYNGTFTWIQTTWDKRYDDLAALVIAKDSPDFFSAMDMDGFPRGIKGMFDPIDDYIDYNSDLWKEAKTVADNFMFKGKHYVAAIGGEPDIVCVYNTATIADKGYDDPAELYWNDEWTWSKFKEMCIDFADAEKDIAGIDGWWYPTAMNNVCGVPIIGMKDGKLSNNMKDPAVTKMQDLIYDLQKNNVVFDRGKHGNQPRDNATTGAGLATHDTLFVPVGLWGFQSQPDSIKATFGDVEAGEVMFVPMPRLDDGDTYYMSTRVDGYFLCKNAPNPKGFKAFMECRMLAKKEAAEISKDQMRDDYHWNDNMIAMLDETKRLANEHPVFTFNSSVSDELTNIMNTVAGATTNTWAGDDGVSAGQTSWTQTVEENNEAVDFILKEMNESIENATKE